eukprot:CAMPEP_0116841796 /NCGR_PEP_ID=MMETSP0418-20121206/11152_1 /TAXON_ID=1158023 /ORGANISM="Astrosyne radiata, Strain 13vi08-1A" /LENGTH=392 /DNA_ID=CAMNT_0004472319 /DNA_START=115 /DNA_END=1293 /DNA_ORIENTATION=+
MSTAISSHGQMLTSTDESSPPSPNSDQFDDAPEDDETTTTGGSPTTLPKALPVQGSPISSLNPLEALAMACAAEKDYHQQERPPQEGAQTASFSISQNDVLCGRGGLTNHHPGNVFFRRLVRMKQESYLLASKRAKAGVAKEIVECIRGLQPPGRFLKKDPQNPGVWVEIGDRKAREKTSQALREGAPELREELQSAELQDTRAILQQQQQLVLQQQQQQQQPSQQQQQQPPPTLPTLPTQPPRMHEEPPAPAPTVSPSQSLQHQHQQPHHQQQPHQLQTSSPKKPRTVASNRARVVSDDAGVLGLRPLFHKIQGDRGNPPQPHVVMDDFQHYHQPYLPPAAHMRQLSVHDPTETESSKRKGSPCMGEERQEQARRGPRLKLLKSRLQNYCN